MNKSDLSRLKEQLRLLDLTREATIALITRIEQSEAAQDVEDGEGGTKSDASSDSDA